MFSILRSSAPRTAPPSVQDITKAVAAGEMALVDVRELAELKASGKAKGALHMPLGLVALKADPQSPDAMLKPGTAVVVYCASGGRSGMAAQALSRLGYGPVWNIGGLSDWVANGGQVERV